MYDLGQNCNFRDVDCINSNGSIDNSNGSIEDSMHSKGNMLGHDESSRQQNLHNNVDLLNHGRQIVSNGNNDSEKENPADDI